MRKLKEVLRLKLQSQLTNRQIAAAIKVSPATVSYYTRAAQQTGLAWQALEELTETELITLITPHCQQRKAVLLEEVSDTQVLDFARIQQEMAHKGVTLQLLWEEYREQYGDKRIPSYSHFCRGYRIYRKQLKPTLRQIHRPGEKCFVDYCGPKIPIYNADNQEVAKASVFVAVLGMSNYTFAKAYASHSIKDWIAANVDALHYFGGSPTLLIPDNEKAGVQKASYYDPDINPAFADFGRYYQLTILPTRPGKPRDKAKVENAVLIVERWIIARLRHQRFYSIAALNQAIAALLVDLNQRAFKRREGSRCSQFIEERAFLKPLPCAPYEWADFGRCKVQLDYHVLVDNHYYSVPSHLLGKTLDYRLTAHSVGLFYQGKSVANHLRGLEKGKATTCKNHMPHAHQQHHQWTPSAFMLFAREIGCHMTKVAEYIMNTQRHPECCLRIHNGFRRLAKHYGSHLLEQACAYAIDHQALRFVHIESILQSKAYLQLQDSGVQSAQLPIEHEHIRGADYFIDPLTVH